MYLSLYVGIAALVALLLLVVLLINTIRSNRYLRRALSQATGRLENLQLSFHRFVPQNVVENIIDRGVATRGERRTITVLFTDLEGFTSLSEVLPPETVVRILNGYFRAMTRVVRRHNGFVARFLGDGILAIFGAPQPNPWHTQDASRAALAMHAELHEYNEALDRDGHRPLSMGIGLETGNVMAGVLGSNELMEYTVIGDVVNTAARVQELTRGSAHRTLVGEQLARALDDRFHLSEAMRQAVKGKSESLDVRALLGIDETALRRPAGHAQETAARTDADAGHGEAR